MAEIVTSIICPLFGVFICTGMGLAPFPAVLEARKQKQLGSINPIPFAMMVNGQLGWTIYGVYKRDYWIFFSSSIPLVFAAVLCSTAIHLLEREGHTAKEEKVRIRVEMILFASGILWLFLTLITGIAMPVELKDQANTVIGAFCVTSSLVFYAAPLLNMVEIVRTKDSTSLYAPAILINLVNCILWFFYGLMGVYAVIIWFPNILGACICIVELLMCARYPAKSHQMKSQKEQARKASVEAGLNLLNPQIDDADDDEPNMDFAVYHSSRKMSTAAVDLMAAVGSGRSPRTYSGQLGFANGSGSDGGRPSRWGFSVSADGGDSKIVRNPLAANAGGLSGKDTIELAAPGDTVGAETTQVIVV